MQEASHQTAPRKKNEGKITNPVPRENTISMKQNQRNRNTRRLEPTTMSAWTHKRNFVWKPTLSVKNPTKAITWQTKEMERALNPASTERIEFHSCRWGERRPKKTTFATNSINLRSHQGSNSLREEQAMPGGIARTGEELLSYHPRIIDSPSNEHGTGKEAGPRPNRTVQPTSQPIGARQKPPTKAGQKVASERQVKDLRVAPHDR